MNHKNSTLKKILLSAWNIFYDVVYAILLWGRIIVDKCYCFWHKPPLVVDVEPSIQYIVKNRCSVARYGDGEMKLVMGRNISFQRFHPHLQKRLSEILQSDDSNLIVCIPNVFGSLAIYTEHDKIFWREYMSRSRKMWYNLLDKNRIYYDAFVSRCYLPYQDKTIAVECFQLWKQLWNGRDLLIVEGEKTRLGIGNDLFDNVRSIKRILAPVINAFERYDELLEDVENYDKNSLVLIALGPTATVLAADLSRVGYQAIDIGHLDIEYEWFLKQVDHKVPVEGKYVNEAGGYSGDDDNVNQEYQSQIVKVFV